MENMRKFDIKYDYSIIVLFSEHSETLIGGSEKAVKKALKNSKDPNLDTKSLDVFYQKKPLGTLAVDINQSALEVEKIQNLVDKLYANLLDKRTNNAKIADTKITLDAMFRADKRFIIRTLARTISVWYEAVTDFYINGKFGFAIPQKERAALGEQFYNDVNMLIETTFTVLKKKTSPHSNAEIQKIIKFNCTQIGEFFAEYSRYLASNKTFCICCKICDNYFLANAWNARYCPECKLLRKKNSKKTMPKNVLREFTESGRRSSIELRISSTRIAGGNFCRKTRERSIKHFIKGLSLIQSECWSNMTKQDLRLWRKRSTIICFQPI